MKFIDLLRKLQLSYESIDEKLLVAEQKLKEYQDNIESLSKTFENSLLGLTMPPGLIIPFGGTLPGLKRMQESGKRLLVCHGQEVVIDEYPMLFDAIGNTWGTPSGYDTFCLPNIRDGRTLVSPGDFGYKVKVVGKYGKGSVLNAKGLLSKQARGTDSTNYPDSVGGIVYQINEGGHMIYYTTNQRIPDYVSRSAYISLDKSRYENSESLDPEELTPYNDSANGVIPKHATAEFVISY